MLAISVSPNFPLVIFHAHFECPLLQFPFSFKKHSRGLHTNQQKVNSCFASTVHKNP